MAEGRYHTTTQKDIDRFMKPKKNVTDGTPAQHKTLSKAAEETRAYLASADASELQGAFEIVDPIPTVIGNIGRFVPDIEHLPKHPSVIAFGKRRTGKTFTTRDLLFKCFRHIPFGVVFSGTAFSGFWQTYVPKRFVFMGVDGPRMQALIDRQHKLIRKWRKDNPEKNAEDPDAYKSEPSLAAFVVFGKSVFPWTGGIPRRRCSVLHIHVVFSKKLSHDGRDATVVYCCPYDIGLIHKMSIADVNCNARGFFHDNCFLFDR